MSRLGTLIKRELLIMTASEVRAVTGDLRKEVKRLKRITANHERRLEVLDGQKYGESRRNSPDLARLRRRLGLSKSNMAMLLGVHRNTIRRLEGKKKPVRASITRALAIVAGMTKSDALRKLTRPIKPSAT